MITRRQSRKIRVGSVEIGGDAPIAVQTMTNTLTSDAKATIEQIRQVEDAGAACLRINPGNIGSAARVVYMAGKPDHKMDNDQMVEHIVGLVEQHARQLEAERAPQTLEPAE